MQAAIGLEEALSAASNNSTSNGASSENGSNQQIAEATKAAADQGQSAVAEQMKHGVATPTNEDRLSKQGGLGTNK